MQQLTAIGLALSVLSAPARGAAPDKAVELARLAGSYTAEYYARNTQVPADKEQLEGLTLEVKNGEWIQNFRGDTAVYTIALEQTDDVDLLTLKHKTVKAVRNCTYELKADTLTVTEQLGEPGEFIVTVWKRKPKTVE